jgi:hypothetical protein
MCYRCLIFGFLFVAIMGTTGCSGGRGNVSGKVTFRGRPVMIGSVVMIAKDEKPVTGRLEEDGSYSLKDVPVGEVQVGVVSRDPDIAANRARAMSMIAKYAAKRKAAGKDNARDMPRLEASPASARAKRKWVRLPKDVEFPDRSGITTTIQRGDNTFDVDLK